MKASEFWDALERVYGPALGRSLASDLYLTPLRATSREALEAGADPADVWNALIDATGEDERARWIYRDGARPGARARRRGR